MNAPRVERGGDSPTGAERERTSRLRPLAKMTVTELKLFYRDPVTVVFTLALPVIMLFVLAGVFGNTPDPEEEVFRGVGAIDYYVPAYVGLVLGSVALIGLPMHLAGYRERGILRRFRASSIPLWNLLLAQVIVTLVSGVAGSLVLLAVSVAAYDIAAPAQPGLFLGAFLLGSLNATALGILLASVVPTARAAQGVGVLLWWVMLILGGAGPPPEVLTDSMRTVAGLLPLRHVILLLQDPWLGFGWNWTQAGLVGTVAAAAAAASLRFFRWE